MSMKEIRAAEAARPSIVLVGTYPPPMRRRPPTAVIPEIALVTDMRGEWRAGTTLQTVWYPTMQPRDMVVDMLVKAPLGEPMPRAVIVPSPVVYVSACFKPSWKGFGSAACFASTAAPFFGGAAAATEIGGFGGQVVTPLSRTMEPRTTSSAMSRK